MKGFTLWRPWPWAIFHLQHETIEPKGLENRTWPPPKWVLGQYIAIHAGKQYDRDAEDWLCEQLGLRELPPEAQCLGIIGVARVVRSHTSIRTLRPAQHRWFFGPYGWELESVQALKVPIVGNGAQGLWNLHEHTERSIREELRL